MEVLCLFDSIQTCPTWTSWSDFGQCSLTCGNGTKTRSRLCDGGSIGDIGCHIGGTEDSTICNQQVIIVSFIFITLSINNIGRADIISCTTLSIFDKYIFCLYFISGLFIIGSMVTCGLFCCCCYNIESSTLLFT